MNVACIFEWYLTKLEQQNSVDCMILSRTIQNTRKKQTDEMKSVANEIATAPQHPHSQSLLTAAMF